MGLKRNSHYFSGRNLISWMGEKYLGEEAHGVVFVSYLCRVVIGHVLLGNTGNGTPRKLNLTERADIDGSK